MLNLSGEQGCHHCFQDAEINTNSARAERAVSVESDRQLAHLSELEKAGIAWW